MKPESRASILIVDDSPEKLVTLRTVLEGLAEELVTVRSGREALRRLLLQEFAVILLDVRMPEMDGFETAQLIRQRRSSEQTPIIFVTAFGEDELSTAGYALGAVDFITTPVRPEVLRSKVSVFLDLFKKARQIGLQADALRRRTEELQHLTRASLAIHGARSLDEMIEVATGFSLALVGADEAVTLATLDPSTDVRRSATASITAETSSDRHRAVDEASLFASLADPRRPVRLTVEEIEVDPRWTALRQRAGLPARARLAAPLRGRDGSSMGWLCTLAAPARAFTADDEHLLTQVAQVTSLALENALFAEAREANRLKDEFLATLSHELRTPLTAILGWVRLLKSEGAGAARIAHGLTVIERNVKAQARLIEDLLDVSRIIAGKFVVEWGELRPVAVVEAVVDALQPSAAAKGVAVELAVDDSVSRVDAVPGDAARFQQVVWNLLSNALKFTPRGGHVFLSIDRVEDRLRLRVADDGVGISPAFLEQAFDRFRQADSGSSRAQGGLGIGLALVRHIVELHGGTVLAESPGPGKGATFTVLLPTAPPAVRGPAVSEPAERGGGWGTDLRGVTVLVVDDDPDAREVLCEMLHRAGASTRVAGSAEEAIDGLRAESIDVLVSDIGMPLVDGLSLIRKVRSSPTPAIASVAVTSYAREDERLRALEAGFDVHLAKPVEPRTLIAAVREATLMAAARTALLDGLASRPPEAGDTHPRKRRILVVEDDLDSRESLKLFLELLGHSVQVAESGVECVEMALRDRPEVALVDIGLPDIDGHDVARRIREGLGDDEIYLIALTGFDGDRARRQALGAGFNRHMAKPVDPLRLQALLQSDFPILNH
jgi:CheY-like chemotaxis protein